MGLLKHLLFWPVTGPAFLIDFSLGKVDDVVKEELTDDGPVKSALLELQLLLELGDIDDAEYVRREGDLMQQLRDIRQWREEFGMGVSGGPVRVQSTEPAAPATEPATPAASAAEAPDSPILRGGETSDDRTPKVARPDDVRIELNLDWDV